MREEGGGADAWARSVSEEKGWGRASAARAGCRWRVGPAGRAGDARGVRARDAAAEGDARAALRGTSAGRRWQVGPGVTGRGERGAGPRGAGLGRRVGRAGRERGKWAWAVGFAGLGLSPVGFGFGLG